MDGRDEEESDVLAGRVHDYIPDEGRGYDGGCASGPHHDSFEDGIPF